MPFWLFFFFFFFAKNLFFEIFQIFIWDSYTETDTYKEPCILKKKTKSEMKLNSEHLLELATLEINAIWRIQDFS